MCIHVSLGLHTVIQYYTRINMNLLKVNFVILMAFTCQILAKPPRNQNVPENCYIFWLLFVNVFFWKIRHCAMAITAIPFSLLMASLPFCTFSLSKKESTLSRKNYFLHRFCALQSSAVGTRPGGRGEGEGPQSLHSVVDLSQLGVSTGYPETRTTDAQRGNSLHCMAEKSIPIPNF